MCVDDRTAALTIAELVRGHFPLAKIHARAYDRIHAIDLLNAGVDFQLRETVLSALEFGRETLVALGIEPEKAAEVLARVRERDEQRLVEQRRSGSVLPPTVKTGPRLTPEPLSQPLSPYRPLSAETRDVVDTNQAAE